MPDASKAKKYFLVSLAGLAVLLLILNLPRLFSGGGKGSRARPERADVSKPALPSAKTRRLLQDPATRVETARRLGRERNPGAVSMLRYYAWKSNDPAFRKACIEALGLIGDAAAIQCLKVLIEDTDADIRCAAVEALATIPGPFATQLLILALRDLDNRVRHAAIVSLCARDDDASTHALIGLARGAGGETGEMIVKALAARKHDAAAAVLADLISGGGDRAVRTAAVKALDPAEASALNRARETFAASNTFERVAGALRPLLTIPSADAVALIVRGLDRLETSAGTNTTETLRRDAAAALARLGREHFETFADKTISGECGLLARQAAAEACTVIGTGAVQAVSARILDWKVFPDPDELRIWIETLGALGDAAGAGPALDRAEAQARFFPGLADDVKAAREAIASRTGAAPERSPQAAVPDPVDPARCRTRLSRLAAPCTTAPGTLPDHAAVLVRLTGGARDAAGQPADVTLRLARRNGQWEPAVWGAAPDLTHAACRGEATAAESPAGHHNLNLRLALPSDGVRPTGQGRYTLALKRDGEAWRVAFEGEHNLRGVRGEGTATVRALCAPDPGAAAAGPGEHPRLLFGAAERDAVRARADTAFGRACVAAVLRRLSGSGATSTADRAVGHALLYALFDDEAHGRRAATLMHEAMREAGAGAPAETAGRLQDLALAYDLAFGALGAARARTAAFLGRFSGLLVPGHGFTRVPRDDRGAGTDAAVCAAVGTAALALWHDPESPPMPMRPGHPPVTLLEPAAGGAPSALPAPPLHPGRLATSWMLLVPHEDGTRPPLSLSWQGKAMACRPLPAAAFHDREDEGCSVVRLAGAAAGDTALLCTGLSVQEDTGVQVYAPALQAGHPPLIWLDDRLCEDGERLLLRPGRYVCTVQVKGAYLLPFLLPSDAHVAWGAWQGETLLQALQQNETAADYALTAALHAARDQLGAPAVAGTAPQTGLDRLLGFAAVFERVTGAPPVPGSPLPSHALQVLDAGTPPGHGFAAVCPVLHAAPPDKLPAVRQRFVQAFTAEAPPELNCRSLAFALCCLPLEF